MKRSEPRKARKRLFAVATIIVSTALALLVVEAGLRLFAPAWLERRMLELNAGAYEAGSDRDWPVLIENGRFRQYPPLSVFTARHYEYVHGVTIDELGGRVTPHGTAPEALVPVVGDSFTFGLGVEDSETFVSLLAPDSPYRLVNLGVPGSALHDHLNIVQMRHEELGEPELYVFVVFMGNDLSDVRARHLISSGGAPDNGTLAFRANVFVFHHPLLKQLYAIQYARQKALALMNRGDNAYMRPVFRAMRTDRSYLEGSLIHWRAELERLALVAGTRGFRYLVVLIPDVHQLDGQRLVAKAESYGLENDKLDPGQLSRAYTGALEDSGVTYFNLEQCLAEAMTEGLFYVQDNHFTAAGHAVAAECIRQSGLMDAIAAGLTSSTRSGEQTAR